MQQFFFAQKAFIVHDGRLLLVQKSNDDPHNPGKWEVPGGRMNFGEDVDEHLKREVFEEVGIEIVPGRPFHIWQWQLERPTPEGERLEIQIVAVARLCKPLSLEVTDVGRVADDYLGASRWINVREINNYDLINNMVPVIGSFLACPEMA
jgi:8-oxo-dGTP diphosphatase